MANGTIAIDEPSVIDKLLDTTELTVGANTVERERVVLAGAAATDLCPVDPTKGLRVDLTNTGANGTAIKVDGSAVTQPVSGSVAVKPGAATGTQSNVAENTSSVTVLAANASRLGGAIYNDSDSAVNLKFGSAASATSFIKRLLPRQDWDFTLTGYTGIITGIWDTAPGTVGHAAARVTELTA